MKTISKITLSLAVMLGLGIGCSYAQSATSPATMEIKTALTIDRETNTEIDFGTISATTPGAIVLNAKEASANQNTGANTNVARFNVAGAPGAAVVFTYDATVNMTNGTPANDITMTPMVVGANVSTARATAIDVNPAGVATAVNLESTAGTYFIWVGGTVGQLTNKTTGTYAGTFNIAVDYN